MRPGAGVDRCHSPSCPALNHPAHGHETLRAPKRGETGSRGLRTMAKMIGGSGLAAFRIAASTVLSVCESIGSPARSPSARSSDAVNALSS